MAFSVNVNKVNGTNVTNYLISITPEMLARPMKSIDGLSSGAALIYMAVSPRSGTNLSATEQVDEYELVETFAAVEALLTASGVASVSLASPTFTGTPVAPTAASGTNTTQVATTAFVQNKKAVTGTASGTDTYTVTFSPAVTPAAGSLVVVRFTNANTGAATLNATAIVRKNGSTALSANDILANSWYQLYHDGTSYVLLGSA